MTALADRVTDRLRLDAYEQYRQCIQKNLATVKKGISDPAKMAKLAHGMCLDAFGKLTAEFGNKLSDAEYYALQEPKLLKWVEQRLPEKQK